MDFAFTESECRWRDEVQAFLDEHVTAELRAEMLGADPNENGPHATVFRKAVGEKGWYGSNWPVEYGGLGRSAIEQQILIDEFDYVCAPKPDLTVTAVAPMIMRYGTDQNKEEFLRPIARGEITVAVGYSEPDAGTDLASLKTRAVLDGDQWVIDGSKIWNSLADQATHEWLCARTDPDAPKHHGISVIMVPLDAPGIEIRPLTTWGDARTNEAFFTGVRVPRTNLIGEINKGWQYITGALDLERGSFTDVGQLRSEVDRLIALCTKATIGGVRLADRPAVCHRLAELDADVEVAHLISMEAASKLDDGVIPTVTVTTEKIYTSELRQKIADYGTQILGAYGQLDWRDPDAPCDGAMERMYRGAPLFRFGGGANEVLRDIIAQRGHGMPSYGRSAKRPSSDRADSTRVTELVP